VVFKRRREGLITNSWGIYTWFEEDGADFIQESYRASFRILQPYGKVFKLVNQFEDFIEIMYRDQSYRVMPELFQMVPSPSFSFGEEVAFAGKPEVLGIISDINWHFKLSKEMYLVEVNGKKKNSRYFSEDLLAR